MKLEVGMYVRTDKGLISQIKRFEEHYTKGKRLVDDCTTKEVVENYLLLSGNQCNFIESIDYSIPPCYPSDEELKKIKKHIKKASFNLIDLIEENDYVNGHLVHEIEEHSDGYDKELHLESCEVGSYRIDRYDAKDKIKSILTHELYEANCYKEVE